jgi:hypothetical protein
MAYPRSLQSIKLGFTSLSLSAALGCSVSSEAIDELTTNEEPLTIVHFTASQFYPINVTYALINGKSGFALDDATLNEPEGIPDSTVYIGPASSGPATSFMIYNWPNQSALYTSLLGNFPTYDDICRLRANDVLTLGALQFQSGGLSMSTLLGIATNPSQPEAERDAALSVLGSCSMTAAQRQEAAAGLGLRAEYVDFLQNNHVLAMDVDNTFTTADLFAFTTVLWALPDPIWIVAHRIMAKNMQFPGMSAGNGVILVNWHDGGPSEVVTIPYIDNSNAQGPRAMEHLFIHEIGHLVDDETRATGEHDRWENLYAEGQGDPEAHITVPAPNAYEDFAAFWEAYFANTPALINQASWRSSPTFKRKVAHIIDVIDHQGKTFTPVYTPDANGHIQRVGNYVVERASTTPDDDGDVVSVNGVPL